jgi:hypothetical protein
MEFGFNAQEWKRLSNAERVKRCRLLAHEASELALSSPTDLKREYLALAEQWELLAKAIERG